MSYSSFYERYCNEQKNHLHIYTYLNNTYLNYPTENGELSFVFDDKEYLFEISWTIEW